MSSQLLIGRRSTRRRVVLGLVPFVVAAALVVGCGNATPETEPTAATSSAAPSSPAAETEADTTPTAAPSDTGLVTDAAAETAVVAAPASTALAALAAVPVQGRAAKTGYDRDLFGAGWVDVDRNGCDTRNDMLARDLSGETFKPGTRNCVVLTGSLADPYSGRTIAFQRGQSTSDDVQIDHVVAVSNSWQTGAQGWDAARRTAFGNDPLNLLAVDGSLNMQKGDGDAATWLPPNKSYRCAYVARQVAVKVAYGLWMTQAERNAIATVLGTCPGELLPGGVVANVPVTATVAAPQPAASAAPQPAPAPVAVPTPAPAPDSAPAPAPAADVYFQNCDAVRAAGAAPIHAGDPGWEPKFDRDNDGVGCE
ncbi:GmrSD restriction endonuclease domain-containing protein [Modestobacter marinus]|uniref:GmrSD restriction endonuclease domain-containing protein n=1 Tax=Modestobacter marinus TaxID=477641 RepID=UPI001C980DF4|nr:DUF1524 domain-containing protein [Modestobacter marinus]